MEKNVVIEQIREVIKVETKFSVIEESAIKLEQNQSNSMINLKAEEEILKTQLENLKKENFSLKSIFRAWKTTYEEKQNKLAQAESKLNKIYNKIWSEREEFCERAEKFNNQYGILSNWWKERMNEVFNPLPEKANEKYQEKVGKLEMKIEEVQEDVEVLEKGDKPPEVFNVQSQEADGFVLNRNEAPEEPSLEPGNGSENVSPVQENEITTSSILFNELGAMQGQMNEEAWESSIPENNIERPKKKKVRFSRENDNITIFYENPGTLKMKFFSIVDTETVRKANRFKKKQNNQLSAQVAKPRNKLL